MLRRRRHGSGRKIMPRFSFTRARAEPGAVLIGHTYDECPRQARLLGWNDASAAMILATACAARRRPARRLLATMNFARKNAQRRHSS